MQSIRKPNFKFLASAVLKILSGSQNLKVGSGHLGFMQITGVAQSCQSGNQAEFTRRSHLSTDQQKNFI